MICSVNIGYLRLFGLNSQNLQITEFVSLAKSFFCSTNQKLSILGKQSPNRAYEGLRHKDRTSGFVSKILALISVTKI